MSRRVKVMKWSRGIRPSTALYRSARWLESYAEEIWGGARVGAKWGPDTKADQASHGELYALAWFLRSMARTAQWESVNARRAVEGLPPKPLRSRRA